jgi:hypothetical protein
VDVRVAVNVDVSGLAGRVLRHVHQGNPLAGIDVAGLAIPDLAVAGLVHQHRRPELQVEPGGDEEVGALEHQGVRGFRLDEVGVFVAARDGLGLHPVAAHGLGDRGVGRKGGHHFDWRGPSGGAYSK